MWKARAARYCPYTVGRVHCTDVNCDTLHELYVGMSLGRCCGRGAFVCVHGLRALAPPVNVVWRPRVHRSRGSPLRPTTAWANAHTSLFGITMRVGLRAVGGVGVTDAGTGCHFFLGKGAVVTYVIGKYAKFNGVSAFGAHALRVSPRHRIAYQGILKASGCLF